MTAGLMTRSPGIKLTRGVATTFANLVTIPFGVGRA